MALYASLSGVRLVTIALTWSTFGSWVADVVGADTSAFPTKCAVAVANLNLVGFVHRQDTFAGQRMARVFGGFGGWRSPVAARPYRMQSPIPLALVLGDAAIEVGEKLAGVSPGATIGTLEYVREAGPASRVLRHLVGRSWWIDVDGSTRVGARPASAVGSSYLASHYQPESGRFTIATEDLAAWSPGATFANKTDPTVRKISSVSAYMGKDAKLRLEVMAA